MPARGLTFQPRFSSVGGEIKGWRESGTSESGPLLLALKVNKRLLGLGAGRTLMEATRRREGRHFFFPPSVSSEGDNLPLDDVSVEMYEVI